MNRKRWRKGNNGKLDPSFHVDDEREIENE